MSSSGVIRVVAYARAERDEKRCWRTTGMPSRATAFALPTIVLPGGRQLTGLVDLPIYRKAIEESAD